MRVPSDRRQKFIGAAKTRTSLEHTHLLPARVARDDRGRVRIFLQRQPLRTLSEVLASGPLDLPTALRLLYGVATAVDALNRAGLVARDLTPDRILVCPRRGGVLADPGIPLEVLPRDTSPDDVASEFRSPEEVAGFPIDARSNVYSLGAVLLATLTAPDGERLALPAPAEAVIRRATAAEPEKRYASAPEFIVTMASAYGLRRRARNDAKRSQAAATKREAPAVTEPPSLSDPSAGMRAPEAPKPGTAPPPPVKREPASPKTRPRPIPVQNESRNALVRQRTTTNGHPADRPGAVRQQASSAPSQPNRRLRMPSLPRLSVPSLPRLLAPSLPRLRAPSLPRLRAPSLPRMSLPRLPRLRAPSLPRMSLPGLPRLRAPSPPRLRAPELPRLRATAMRRLALPTLPRLRGPDLAWLQGRARSGAAVLLFGLAVGGFFLAGMLLGRGGGDESQSALIERASFAIKLPADWGETRVARRGGIKLSTPVAAAPRGEGGAGLVIARVPDIVSLDRRFRVEVNGDGYRTEVRLGRLKAWRYTGLRAKRGTVAAAYLAPTTGDPLLFICHAPQSEARARLAECESIASTIALRGDRPGSLAAVTRHQEQLVSVMTRLRRERLHLRRQLAGVELASDQARTARDLEQTYKEAAARLAQGEPPAGTTELDDLVGSLRLTASAYGELADAAAEVDKAGYRAASEAVLEGEEAIRREAADPKPA
jgi:serine/threonine protein kinase